MTAKFPLAKDRQPGNVYTYSSEVEENYIKEAVITDKNIKDAYENILKVSDGSEDTLALKVRLNTLGIIVGTGALEASDLPPHTHENADEGGVLLHKHNIYTLNMTKNVSNYAIPGDVYRSIAGIYINGFFTDNYTKEANSEIVFGFVPDMDCEAKIVYC